MCLIQLLTVLVAPQVAAKLAGTTLRAAGWRSEVCDLHAVLWRLSLQNWTVTSAPAPPPDPACPAHAEEVVAVATFAVVGFVAPLAAVWAIEMAYRAHFAARQPLGRAHGPLTLQWRLSMRLTYWAAASFMASCCAVSVVMLASDAGLL